MVLNAFPGNSLKFRISIATLAIFLVGIFAMSLYASNSLRVDMERMLGEQQFSTASILASQVNLEMSTRIKTLEIVAASAAQLTQISPTAAQRLLDQRLLLQAQFNGGVAVLAADGTAVADAPHSAGRLGIDFIDDEAVSLALRQRRSAVGVPHFGKGAVKDPVFRA
jgi:hypothetical protein